jgi:prepilin-type N-terminal cleavage/methylation domain-containing protein
MEAHEMRNYDGFSLLELMIVVAIILIIAMIAIPNLLRSQQTAQESSAVSQLRTINTAEVTYITTNQGSYGDIPSLIAQGLLDNRFTGQISGYLFTLTASGQNYTATASAVSSNSGRFDFYTQPDYIIRYSTDPTRAPLGFSGEPVR